MSKKEVKCFRCKELVVKDESIHEVYETEKTKTNRYFHKKCYDEYKANQQEYKEMDEVCQYIKKEIFGWSDKQRVPKHLVSRIQGIKTGEFVPNRNGKVYGNANGYPYDVILKTIKYKKLEMVIAFKDKSKFKDDEHRVNYLISIILSNINDVYMKLKAKKESDQRLETLQIEFNENQHEFNNKTNLNENKVSNKLKHLW